MELIQINPDTQTMSSLDLAQLCVGDKKDAHSDFVKKMRKVLGGSMLGNFSELKKYTKARVLFTTCLNVKPV